ncbi:hypothetical protein J6590_078804 [Homalodisca vitripennis]|nr:hypothetical protein J6590_078804 [Homalodisca vitripennis]
MYRLWPSVATVSTFTPSICTQRQVSCWQNVEVVAICGYCKHIYTEYMYSETSVVLAECRGCGLLWLLYVVGAPSAVDRNGGLRPPGWA